MSGGAGRVVTGLWNGLLRPGARRPFGRTAAAGRDSQHSFQRSRRRRGNRNQRPRPVPNARSSGSRLSAPRRQNQLLHHRNSCRREDLAGALPGTLRYGAIAGHIRDSRGTAAPSAQIVAISETAQFPVFASNGTFRIFGFPPGRYRVATVTADTRRGVIFYPTNSQPRELTIAGGEDYGGVDFLVPGGDLHSIGGAINAPDDGKYKGLTLVSAEHPELKIRRRP